MTIKTNKCGEKSYIQRENPVIPYARW